MVAVAYALDFCCTGTVTVDDEEEEAREAKGTDPLDEDVLLRGTYDGCCDVLLTLFSPMPVIIGDVFLLLSKVTTDTSNNAAALLLETLAPAVCASLLAL